MAVPALDEWTGEGASVAEIERRLADLRAAGRADGAAELRTSVLTHIVWAPEEWNVAVQETLGGLGDRYPSRAIQLLPEPEAGADRLDASISLFCFAAAGQERHVCSEVIMLRLLGRLCESPGSIVAPLVLPNLPVFLRWRGRPPFGSPRFDSFTGLVDRLVVDSEEWPDVPEAYPELAGRFDAMCTSDIAWARTHRWRVALASLWPGIADVRELSVTGPVAQGHLLAGWLRSRLRRAVELSLDEAPDLEALAVDGRPVAPAPGLRPTPADLLSAELDEFGRDPVYEAAVAAAQ
jgi:hypothetical protein